MIFIDSIEDFTSDEEGFIYSIRKLKGNSLVHPTDILESNRRLRKESLHIMNPSNRDLLDLGPFIEHEYSKYTNRREPHIIDHIQQDRYQYKAFRYASLCYKDPYESVPL